MKKLLTLLVVSIFLKSATAQDAYAYYSTKDPNGRTIDTKMYAKNGDARMEIIIDMAGMKISTASLVLKKNPEELIILNSLAKAYTKMAKPKKKLNTKNYTLTIIGKEKIGAYNCTHIRVKADDKLYDTWFTKDLPALQLPIENNQTSIDKSLSDKLALKGISGMMVKTIYFNPGSTVPKLTMQLIKYESKPLSSSLFTIPSDYKESKGNPYQNISPEKRKEMMNQMMKQLKDKN